MELATKNGYSSIAPTAYYPCQMSVSEARVLLEESEDRFSRGVFVSEEQMDAFIENLQ